jgi:cation:H+ antiporter
MISQWLPDRSPRMAVALLIWVQFLVCVALIGVAGTALSRYGDVIADKTGLGGTWIGLVLLATVTSLPELITGVSSVTLADTPDIAVGDVLGSCVFNLFILTMLDLLQREDSVYTRAAQGHILSAGFGVMLIGVVGLNLLLAANGMTPSVGHVGLYTPVILIIYAVAMRTLFRYEAAQRAAFAAEAAERTEERYPGITLGQAILRYLAAAAVVVAAGTALPFVGERMAQLMGWHQSFVGTLFVAAATSVPEVVVTVAALRIGALDMAVSNVLGSNLFDIVIIAVDDLLFTRGPILQHVAPLHAVSALSAMIMSGIVVVGIFYRPRTRLFRAVGWASLLLFTMYIFNSVFLYLASG